MNYIPTNLKINVEWTVKKGIGNEAEDFSRSIVALFLFSGENRWVIPCEAGYTGVVTAQLPETLPDGVYSFDLIWYKNDGSLNSTRCVQRTRKACVFAIDAAVSHPDNWDGQPVTLKMNTVAAPYGYDGLSAYEIAVLRGATTLDEYEWSKGLFNDVLANELAQNQEEIKEAQEDISKAQDDIQVLYRGTQDLPEMRKNIRKAQEDIESGKKEVKSIRKTVEDLAASGGSGGGGASIASAVVFDNTNTGFAAANVQDAIDEAAARTFELNGEVDLLDRKTQLAFEEVGRTLEDGEKTFQEFQKILQPAVTGVDISDETVSADSVSIEIKTVDNPDGAWLGFPVATQEKAGVITASDKQRLDEAITSEDTDMVVESIEEGIVHNALRKTKQILTEEEKKQARENIGAVSEQTFEDEAVRVKKQILTSEQKYQARHNISAITAEEAEKIAQDKINETSVSSPDKLQAVKELSSWLESNPDSAATMNESIQENAADIQRLYRGTGLDEYSQFSTVMDYAIGDIVLYDGVLFRFKAGHAAGEWDYNEVEDWSEKKEREEKVAELGSNPFYIDMDLCDSIELGESSITIKSDNIYIGSNNGLRNVNWSLGGLWSVELKPRTAYYAKRKNVITNSDIKEFVVTDTFPDLSGCVLILYTDTRKNIIGGVLKTFVDRISNSVKQSQISNTLYKIFEGSKFELVDDDRYFTDVSLLVKDLKISNSETHFSITQIQHEGEKLMMHIDSINDDENLSWNGSLRYSVNLTNMFNSNVPYFKGQNNGVVFEGIVDLSIYDRIYQSALDKQYLVLKYAKLADFVYNKHIGEIENYIKGLSVVQKQNSFIRPQMFVSDDKNRLSIATEVILDLLVNKQDVVSVELEGFYRNYKEGEQYLTGCNIKINGEIIYLRTSKTNGIEFIENKNVSVCLNLDAIKENEVTPASSVYANIEYVTKEHFGYISQKDNQTTTIASLEKIDEIQMLLGYGQSLMAGSFSGKTVSKNVKYNNIMKFKSGVRLYDNFGLNSKRKVIITRNKEPRYGEMFLTSNSDLSEFDNNCISSGLDQLVLSSEEIARYEMNFDYSNKDTNWRTGIYYEAWELRENFPDYRITEDIPIEGQSYVSLETTEGIELPYRLHQLKSDGTIKFVDSSNGERIGLDSDTIKIALQVCVGTNVSGDNTPIASMDSISKSYVKLFVAKILGGVEFIPSANGTYLMHHQNGETPMTGFAERYNDILLERYGNIKLGFETIVSCAAYGSASFESLMPLDKGGTIHVDLLTNPSGDGSNMNYFECLMLAVKKAKEYADAKSKKINVPSVVYFHESVSGAETEKLKAYRLLQLFTLINSRIKEITHQGNDIVFILHQSSLSDSQNHIEGMLSVCDNFELTDEEKEIIKSMPNYDIEPYNVKNVIMGAPTYPYEFVSDKIHKTSLAQRIIGETCAISFYDSKKERFKPLCPINYKVIGNKVYIKYHVPCPPIVIDTEAINGTQSSPEALERGDKYGFIFKCENGYKNVITNVSVVESDTILIEASENVENLELEYAYTRTPNSNWGTSKMGQFGNVRDSRQEKTTINGSQFSLYNWSIGFKLPYN